MNIEVIARLVIKQGENVLLCLNKAGAHYFLPGGHIEAGDSVEKTIYKEMDEELGWNNEAITSIKFVNYLENFYKEDGKEHHEINLIFEIQINPEISINSKEEHISFEWIPKDKLMETNLLPKEIIPFILK